MSTTVTANTHDAWLPAASDAWHVMLVWPSANTLFVTSREHPMNVTPTLSLAVPDATVGTENETMPVDPLVAVDAIIPALHVSFGASLSIIAIANEQLAVSPDRSVAVHVTVVDPGPKLDPVRGVHDDDCRPTLSVAVAEYDSVTTALPSGSDVEIGGGH